MHYYCRYKDRLMSKNDNQAWYDIKGWLGAKDVIVEDALVGICLSHWKDGLRLRVLINNFKFALGMAGIKGYPAMAFLRIILTRQYHLCNKQNDRYVLVNSGRLYPLFKSTKRLVETGCGNWEDYAVFSTHMFMRRKKNVHS